MLKITKKAVAFLLSLCFMIPQITMVTYAKPDGKRIMVSLGDSYSSGEGVEPFYGVSDGGEYWYDSDFLAHRSEKSWPGKLRLPGVSGSMKNHKDDNWYFVASSGAKTKHFKKQQNKTYDRDGNYNSDNLDPQLEVFKKFEKNEVDYVTMTIGGNDVGFSNIVASAVTSGQYFFPNKVANQLNDAWDSYYNGKYDKKTKKRGEPIKDKIEQAYKDVQIAAGVETKIIVAGYPQLINPNISPKEDHFNKKEAQLIDDAVSKFNDELESIVNTLHDGGMKIYFVSVEDEFKGHEAYSDKSYINGMRSIKPYDLKDTTITDLSGTLFSSYSMHPNKDGTEAYARCVQAKIDELEADNNTTTTATTEAYDDGWKQAYVDFLNSYKNQLDNTDHAGFSLVYINNDDIPELVVHENVAHVYRVNIYTYSNSAVTTLLEDVGSFASVGYIEKQGVIVSSYANQGYYYGDVYQMDGVSCSLVYSLFTDEGAVVEGGTVTYTVNDKDVSRDEWERITAPYAPYTDESLSRSFDKDQALTQANINAIAN